MAVIFALSAHDPEFDAQMSIADEIMSENDALLRKLPSVEQVKRHCAAYS